MIFRTITQDTSRSLAIFSAPRRAALLCGCLLAAVLTLLPTSAQAQCKQWDVSGTWDLEQSNGYFVRLELSQKGTEVKGKASYGTVTEGTKVLGVLMVGGDTVTHTLDVNGNIEGDDFYALIGRAGVYRAKVGSSGRLDGTTYDSSNPSSTANWFSGRAMKCAKAGPAKPFKITSKITLPPSTPSPSPSPIKSSGKARVATPPPPPMKVPGIVASQVIFPTQPIGFVVLTWDGGPDHPYAEVWCKIDGGDEFFCS